MKRTKKLLSFFLAIVMVIATIPAFSIISNAATVTTLSASNVYCVANHAASSNTGRYNMSGNGINICNDGGSDNFNAGYFKFDISTLPEYIDTLTGSQLTVNITSVNGGANGIEFYATTTVLAEHKNSFTTATGDTAKQDALNLFSNKIYLGRWVHIGNSTTAPGTVTINSDISDVVKYMRSSGLTTMGIVAVPIGVGPANINNSKLWSDTLIKDVKIENINYTELSITNSAGGLKSVMNRYESKMADGNVYTNTGDAYTAYVAACKAYDSNYYGGNASTNVLTPAQNLVKATNKMMKWTPYTPYALGSFDGDNRGDYSGYDARNYYKGLAYSPKSTGDGDEKLIDAGDWRIYLRMNNSECVAVYTGNEISIPVMFSAKTTRDRGWDNCYCNVWGVYPTTSGFYLTQKWNAYDTSRNFTWLIGGGGGATSIPYTSNTVAKTSTQGRDSYKFAANVLKYNSNPFSDGQYSTSITPAFQLKGGVDATTSSSLSTVNNSAQNPIYFINYKALTDAVDANKSVLADVSKYKEGGLSTVLTGFQSGTGINPSLYSYANGISGATTTCGNDIKSAVTNISGAKTADDPSRYPKLRSIMDQSKALYDSNDELGLYTTSSFEAFKSAYTVAKNAMSNVATTGYIDDMFTNAATVAANLETAYNNLKQRANFTDLASKYTDAAAKLAETDKYTTSTYNALKDLYDNAEYATKDAAQRADTSKPDYQSAIDAEATNIKNAIDALKERADFTQFNEALNIALEDNYLGYRTDKNTIYGLPTHSALSLYNNVHFYDQADTPVDNQSDVNAEVTDLGTANSAVYNNIVDQTNLNAFIDSLASYDKDVFDTATVNAIKTSANDVYKVVNFNGTNYYSLDVTDQADLDAKIRDYINSFNSSLDKYSVAVSSNVTVKVNGITQSPNAETGKYEFVYGTKVEFSAPTADTAWYMNYNSESASRTQQFQKYAQTYTATIIGNMTIDARTKSDATPYRVTVERDYGVEGMTNGMAFVDYTAGGNYTLPTMPNHPYYSFDGYYVGGAKLDGNTVNITGNTTVIAKYVKNGSDLTVNVNGTPSTYAYNSKVTISEPGAYAWVEKVVGSADTWRPFYIGSGCTFRVTESIELKPVTQEQFNSMFAGKEAFAPNTRQSGAIADASTNKATINAQRVDYLPEGAQITEYGILVAKDARTDDFNLENTNEQSIRAKSTKLISGNQFSIGLTNLANTNFTYRSYMIYQVPATTDETGKVTSWETKTVYSEIMTYSGATV